MCIVLCEHGVKVYVSVMARFLFCISDFEMDSNTSCVLFLIVGAECNMVWHAHGNLTILLGAMFGKGVYFSDMVSKSANYCFTNRTNTTGVLLLCEVVLGTEDERYKLQDADGTLPKSLPSGKCSVVGLGRVAPNPTENVTTGTATVPLGCAVETGVVGAAAGSYTLQYNEYVVYDTTRIRMKYLVRAKFVYGGGSSRRF